MKNLFKLLFLLVFIVVLGCQQQDKPMQKDDTLVIGLSAEYPPFEFQQQGTLMGFDVDLSHALADELGKKIQIQDMPFHSLIPALQSGKIDLAISGMTVTPERQKNIDFSNQYYTNSLAIVYLKSGDVPKLTQLCNNNIGVQLGSTMEKWAKQQTASCQKATLVALDTNPPLIEQLKLQRIHFIVLETVQAIAFCKADPKLAFIKIGPTQEGIAVAMVKGSALVPQINTALNTLEQKGILEQLKKKWALDI